MGFNRVHGMNTLDRLIEEMLEDMELAGVVERRGVQDGEPLYAFTPLAQQLSDQFGDDAPKEIARLANERRARIDPAGQGQGRLHASGRGWLARLRAFALSNARGARPFRRIPGRQK